MKGFDKLDNVFYLKHYKNAFSDPNWDWSDKWELDDCDSKVACLGSNCEDYSYRYVYIICDDSYKNKYPMKRCFFLVHYLNKKNFDFLYLNC